MTFPRSFRVELSGQLPQLPQGKWYALFRRCVSPLPSTVKATLHRPTACVEAGSDDTPYHHPCHPDRLASDVLHSLRQLTNLGSVLFIGWRDQQGQQIPQLFAIVPISLSSSFLCPFP